MPVTPFVLCSVVLAAAWFLTGRLRDYALRRQLMDVPGARSSHQVPTPRGGGVSIVIATSAALAWTAWNDSSHAMPVGVLIGGLIVAAVGFIDDHGHLPPWMRLFGHTAAAIVAIASVGGAPSVAVLGRTLELAWIGEAAAVVFVVWLLNLTNFMDGIDGFAGLEIASAGAAGALLFAVAVPGDSRWLEPLLLAAAATGFLLWNWPPARIFMGDAGSGYVGFMTAMLTLRAAWAAPALGWSWIILFGVFIVDATVTLLVRTVRRDRVLEAHRSHAYQHLAIRWRAHKPVTLLLLAINLLWLAPLAWMVATQRLDGAVGVTVAFVPMIVGAVLLGAGVPQPTRQTNRPLDLS